ncbi:MAG: DUF1330 domain-containing protein [Rhodobacteraceae bacterium]|nr:DUF1330 domain-containing protein [Paracoccaceae bacterium]
MPKGYWIARVDVHDMQGYQAYIAANKAAFAAFGGRFLVRGGTFENPEGGSRARNVVIEFPSYQAALACYDSDLYRQAMARRLGASEGDLVIIEGYDS